MADTNLSSIAGVLKRRYDSYVESQQNLEHRMLDEIAKDLSKYSPSGEGYFGAISDYGNESVGAINEEEQFRTIDSEHYAQWKVIPKINVAPIQFSGLAAKAAQGDDESFVDAVIDALDKARERLLKDENRQFFGYGTGVLGAAAVSLTVTTITSFTVASAQYFRANMVIDIFTSVGGTALLSGARVSDVDKTSNILYLAVSIAATIPTTAVIVKQHILDSAPSDGKEMMGLRGIVDDGTDLTTFQNINTSSLIWRSRRINASSANLTSDLMQRLLDDVRVLGGKEPDTLIMHPLQRRKYLDLVVPQKRFEDGKMDAGFQKLEFNGRDLMLDEDCQTDTLYAVTKKMLRKFELAPLEMGAHDGSDVFLRLANFDVFQAYWKHYANIGTSKRTAHGKIVSLATPTGIA